MLGGDGTDSLLKYILPDACGLLRLRPFVPGSYSGRFLRHVVGRAYPFEGSPRVHSSENPGSLPRSMGEAGWAVRW
jgi:hypothetical protein